MNKILAIIPARAGSKGIPNKNIRIINKHPLIYYAIQNALKSKYISEIIVSTDSEEISMISENLGVKVHHREEKLCKDDVTLDSVIFDAIPKNNNYDFIITLQPTSPTLKVETLDKAIEYAFENNVDTLISVINKPHLSWHEENGKKIPNYSKRLNRQYLPSNYMETGAFVISRFNIVTENSRIGKIVDVYELSENESLDIDSYNDLFLAERSLRKQKIAIFTNGNNNIGTGHIYRALELADGIFSKCDIFYDSLITEKSIFGKTKHNLISIKNKDELFDYCRKEKYTVFINDILETEENYIENLRKSLPVKSKIINFEDIGPGSLKADFVINALLNNKNTKKMKFGSKFYISPKAFLFSEPIKIEDKVFNVFICFGGADPQNYTERLLSIIEKSEYKNINFTVVLGRAKNNVEKLMKFNNITNISVRFDVDNIAKLMSESDIAITSRGRTCYELAMLGIPVIAMSQNSREEMHEFVSKKNGFEYLGLNPSDELIEEKLRQYINSSTEFRKNIQNKLLKHDLKSGRERILKLIEEL